MGLAQDLGYGARRLRRTPLFTAGVAATLTLAIAANVVVFSAVSASLLRPLSIREPQRVVVLSESDADRGQAVREVSYRDFADWRAQSRSFTALAAIGSTTWDLLLDRPGGVARIEVAPVSGSFFDLLGAVPRLGRGFVPADDVRGAGRVIVLGAGLWRRQFGSDPAVVGRRVVLSGDTFTVVGVMAPEFSYPAGAEAWTPVTTTLPTLNARFRVDTLELRSFGLLYVVGRLAPGVSVEQARSEIEGIARRLPATKVTGDGAGIAARPLLDDIFGPTRRGLILLFAMVGAVLLIACANVSSLVLARASSLRATFAVKSALGASRSQLVREWVAEIGLVTVVSAAAGVLLAWIGLDPLMTMAPSSFPRLEPSPLDPAVLGFALGLCVVTTLLCAVVPALHVSTRGARDASRRAPGGGGPRAAVARGCLTAAQMAFAAVVLTGAGLLVRSFDQLRRVDLGFEPRQLLTLDVEPQTATAAEYRLAYDAIIERIAAIPGVEAAGAVNLRPLSEGRVGMDSGYLLEGQRIDAPATWRNNVTLNFQAVTPGYFAAMGITIRRGRSFASSDTADSGGVAIVSESTARRLWPGQDPLGRRISIAAGRTESGAFPMQTVVGVVGDVRYRGVDDGRFDIYMPASQTQERVKHLMVRAAAGPAPLTRAIREAVGRVTGRAVVEYAGTMEQVAADAVAPWRFSMVLVTGLAVLGGVLAAAGLYALVAYSVQQRRHELAVRLAVGAGRGAMLRMVAWQGGRFALGGLSIGVGLALVLAGRMSPLLFQVQPRDVYAFAAAAGVLAVTAVAANVLAARRVVDIDPASLIRES